MQSAFFMANMQMSSHVLAIRFVGVERISILDAAGEAGLVERRCRQRAIRSVELSGLKVLADDSASVVVGVSSIEEAIRISRDVSSVLSTIPPVAGVRLSVGCGYACGEARAALMEHAQAAARRALDDQLVVVEPGASSAANGDEESLMTDARVIELTPGMAVDLGLEVLHVAFRNQITSLVGSGRRLMIGRANQADIHIPDQSVSRQHGRIGFENGEAYFTDLSTNGSRVIDSSGETMLAKKQTVALGASGQIILGTNAGAPIHPPIRYVVSRTRGSRDKPVQENCQVDVGEGFEGLTATRII